MSQTNLLLIGASAVVVALSIYAALLWRKVWRNKQLVAQNYEERNARLEGDIRILAQGLTSGELPLIEGAIRIKVLLDNYSGQRWNGLDVKVFETIYDATAHIPTHQKWKDLPKAERRLHERQMETLEKKHSAEVQRIAAQLGIGTY